MQGPSQHDDDDDGAIAQINIIPLVDVVLVLLIIFMVTTVFTKDSALPLDLPKGYRANKQSAPPAEITVSVDKTGTITVNAVKTHLKDLSAAIIQHQNTSRKTIVVLRGDKSVLYGTIMPVLDEVSRSGMELTLALKPGEAK
jgi:biopolymer transport protein ExbD